ncbi:hypothetical protein BGZ63DRAFT_383905 [Mariannaea sp. PMI_226]|nr:hypothetical protein BGZ63DRAFT_383905 [Mariannaea sp. PMI_226]
MSSFIDKVKNMAHSDKSSQQPEGTHGPHSSRAANAADPRVDSDRDHRAQQGLGRTGDYSNTGEYTATSTGGAYSENRPFNTTDGPATRTDGPHKSNMMNKADPRVDSDRDYSRNMGANPHGTSGTGAHNVNETNPFSGSSGYDTTATRGEGLRSEGLRGENLQSNVSEGTFGPHSSRAANAADPRVDSDFDNSRNMGLRSGGTYGTTTGDNLTTGNTHGTRTHGENLGTSGYGTSTTTGRENVLGGENLGTSGREHFGSSGRDTLGTSGAAYGSSTQNTSGLGTQGSTTFESRGTGPAPSTAGPHKSDMMNKMDPRVDSDLDGSKTLGAEKTFSRSNQTSSSEYAHKDPTDAAQVPPSVMQKHIGPPVIAHDNPTRDHARRHSVSHQEQHRGL